MENIILFEIILNVKPHGIVTKSDIDGNKFLEIIEIVLSAKKYRCDFVSMEVEEICENKGILNDLNRINLQDLSHLARLFQIIL